MSHLPRTVTRAEVARHNAPGDLWLIHDGKVYDVSKYYPSHPGGSAMLKQAGKDVSTVLSYVPAHGFAWDFIYRKLNEFYIADLK